MVSTTFNSSARTGRSGFDGDLCATFKCQAANDPQFEGLSAKDTIEARAGLAGIANNNKSTAFGTPGLAQAALAGMAINTVPLTTAPNVPTNKPVELGNG